MYKMDHFFKYLSTITKAKSIPCWARGRPSTKSKKISSYICSGIGRGMYKPMFWDFPLVV
jgi:hypothetical protein